MHGCAVARVCACVRVCACSRVCWSCASVRVSACVRVCVRACVGAHVHWFVHVCVLSCVNVCAFVFVSVFALVCHAATRLLHCRRTVVVASLRLLMRSFDDFKAFHKAMEKRARDIPGTPLSEGTKRY